MSRDANGDYTLPLADVATGGTITHTWANTTLDDIETTLTASLDRYGRGGMLSAFENLDGSVSAPGMAFTGELNTGIYRVTTNDMRAGVGGVVSCRWKNDAATPAGSQRPFDMWDGQAAFDPIDPASAGTVTFDEISSSAASTVGNTMTVTAGGMTGDTAAITGDSSLVNVSSDVAAFGATTSWASGHVNVSGSGATYGGDEIGLGGLSRQGTGHTRVAFSAGFPSGTYQVVFIQCYHGTGAFRTAYFERYSDTQVDVYTVDSSGTLVDCAYKIWGEVSV